VEADYYIAAGDQVTWSKGLDRCGAILQRRADRMYVLPGNHESADQIAAMWRATASTISTGGISRRAGGTLRAWLFQTHAVQHPRRV